MLTADDPTTLSLEELHDVRAKLQHEDDVVSFRAGSRRPVSISSMPKHIAASEVSVTSTFRASYGWCCRST